MKEKNGKTIPQVNQESQQNTSFLEAEDQSDLCEQKHQRRLFYFRQFPIQYLDESSQFSLLFLPLKIFCKYK